jgi:hypothetical protein
MHCLASPVVISASTCRGVAMVAPGGTWGPGKKQVQDGGKCLEKWMEHHVESWNWQENGKMIGRN